MSDNQNTNPPADNDNTNPPVNDQGGGDDKDWKAEAEKWKGFSRKHEDAVKKLREEVENLKNASMSDAEKALADARKEGESSGLKKAIERVVKAELKAAAAEKGVKLPDLDALNLAKFADDDGEVDSDAVEKFISTLSPVNNFASGKDLGIGKTGGPGVRQWTRDDLKGKSHQEIVQARKAGHLDQLLGRE